MCDKNLEIRLLSEYLITSIVPIIGIRVIKDGCNVSSLKKWKDSKINISPTYEMISLENLLLFSLPFITTKIAPQKISQIRVGNK